MNKMFVALGVVLLALGIVAYYITSQTSLIGGRTHNIYPLGGIGLAVLGALIIVGAMMMGKPGATAAGQFKCAQCGAEFGSQSALDQHSKAKHGTPAKS
jgi:hypothetical protein